MALKGTRDKIRKIEQRKSTLILETAVNGRANLLITFKVRDYWTAPAFMVLRYRGEHINPLFQ